MSESAAAASVCAALRVSPWQAFRLIRLAFDIGAARTSAAYLVRRVASRSPPAVGSGGHL